MIDKEKILERWAELYADNPSTVNIDDSREEAIPNFLKCEVETAINELKIGKSPGLDQIYSEYLKAGGEPLLKALMHLFNQILTTGKVPKQFKEALIVVIYKKKVDLNAVTTAQLAFLVIYTKYLSVLLPLE